MSVVIGRRCGRPGGARTACPAEQPKTQRNWKHTIKVYSVFAGIATLAFVYISDMFAGDEVGSRLGKRYVLA
jgi:hypothetical protein